MSKSEIWKWFLTLVHLALGWTMNTNDENLWYFFIRLSLLVALYKNIKKSYWRWKIFDILYTQISKAIYSPILGQTPKWFRINSFGFITCYRPGSNQFKRNLLFKTYFNSWLWCVNLVDFHFFLKFLNFISISNSQNHLWTLQWRE